ncbi:MAG: ATP-binding protein [Myxococcota bacterium]
MQRAPIPDGEVERLAALRELGVLDSAPEDVFERLTELACTFLDVPIALVSLVDERRHWFKSRVGVDVPELSRDHGLCSWTILGDQLMEVEDTLKDARFANNPLVQGQPHVRFYAGAPLVTSRGSIGTFCVVDHKPRKLDHHQKAVLESLAATTLELLRSRKITETAVERTELLTIAEELAGVGHWRVDLVQNHMFWSQQVYEIHGLDPGSYTPTIEAAVNAYHPDDRSRLSELLERTRTTQTPFEFEGRLLRTDGSIRLVQTSGRPQIDRNTGDVTAIFGVFRDITDDRALQRRLVQAEKMASVGTLAAGVAHEINNPLSYIHANALALSEEIAELVTDPRPELRELSTLIEEIREGTQRIKKIVGGLKTFSRTADRNTEVLELRSILETAARLCGNELRHRTRFAIEVADDTPPVEADEAQLVQVAVNLIVNACQAIQTGSVADNMVTVRAGQDGDDVFFEVEDSGVGMTPEVLREAFTPFFTTKPQGTGTGLGLAICHGIVSSFGGRVEVRSTVGQGTRVRVRLAAARASATPAMEPPRTPVPRVGSARVLIVDDDLAVGRALARLLRPHQVDVVSEPSIALARIRNGEVWDVILSDLMMPSMSGPAFHAAIAASRPELAKRMILITGGVFTDEGRVFLDSVVLPVLEKPIEGETLRGAVRAMIASCKRT